MATRTGLLLTKTVRGNARSLGKVDGNKLLSVVLEGLKNSPIQDAISKTWRFLDKHLGEQGLDGHTATVGVLVCTRSVSCSVEFFRPSRTTDNNLLPSTFPSDRALTRTVLVSNKPVLVAIVNVALLVTRGV